MLEGPEHGCEKGKGHNACRIHVNYTNEGKKGKVRRVMLISSYMGKSK